MKIRLHETICDWEQEWIDHLMSRPAFKVASDPVRSKLDKALERVRAERDKLPDPYPNRFGRLFHTQPNSTDRLEFDGIVVTAAHPGVWRDDDSVNNN